MTPILGFSPDLPSTTPGVLVDCSSFIPFITGMEAASSGVASPEAPGLASAARGAAILEELGGTRRVLAGTASGLLELTAGAWVNIGGAYTLAPDSTWSFAQFGATSLAANAQTKVQRSVSGAFADIAQAPKAKIIYTVGYYVVALNIDDGALKPNGWACCNKFDETTWAATPSNLADSGQLLASPGQITAGARLGDNAVAYKESSIYVGNFVESSTQTIDWRLVPADDTGCVGPDALCVLDSAHFFVGHDDFWVFDGSRPVPVGGAVREWYANNSDPKTRQKIKCLYDRQSARVYVSFPSVGSESNNRVLVWHTKTKQWGRDDRMVQAWLNYKKANIVIDDLDNFGSVMDALPDIPFDSAYWVADGRVPAYFDSLNRLLILSGLPGDSSFTTGDVGDDQQVTMLSKIRVRYSPGYFPTQASMQCSYKFNLGEGMLNGSAGVINDGKFDARQSGRFHRVRCDFRGRVRVEAVDVKAVAVGDR